MTDKKIIEAMARLEQRTVGDEVWEQDGKWWTAIDGWVGRLSLPAYLTSHDACQRVTDGLLVGEDWREAGMELARYDHYLTMVINHRTGLRIAQHLATPCQKCEAILKAKGEWND